MRVWPQTIALVTGASQGIGRAAAALMAERGATVYVCARSAQLLDELAQAYPGRVLPHVADVSDHAQVKHLMERIMRERGRLDVLLHNASVLGPKLELEATPVDEWRRALSINLDGSFFVIKEAAALLRAAGPGSILLNVSSSVGRQGRGGWGAYSVSKFGVEALTQIAQDELGPAGVICATVNPGGTATQMRALAYPQEDPNTLPTAQKVGLSMVFLSSILTVAQADAGRYSSRELFTWMDKQPWDAIDPAKLPRG